jgi:hypothetical protein
VHIIKCFSIGCAQFSYIEHTFKKGLKSVLSIEKISELCAHF